MLCSSNRFKLNLCFDFSTDKSPERPQYILKVKKVINLKCMVIRYHAKQKLLFLFSNISLLF